MQKFLSISLFLTVFFTAGINAQNIQIKVNKNFNGAKNERLNLVLTGETYSGSNTIHMQVDATLDGDYYVYTMTSDQNMAKLNAALAAGKRYRVFYQSFPTSSITNNLPAQIGNFTSPCKDGDVVTIVAVGQNCH